MSALTNAVKHLLITHGGFESRKHLVAVEAEEKADNPTPIPDHMLAKSAPEPKTEIINEEFNPVGAGIDHSGDV